MISRADLLAASRERLRGLLAAGHPIDPTRLDNTRYRGISLGLPAWVERLSWKKFSKAFHRDPRTHALRGWNIRIEQDGLDQPWRPKLRRGAPWTFGHFSVLEDRDRVVLDYGAGGNRRFDPLGMLRDPLVALEPGSIDRLLGWSYLAIGPARIPTPSYFLLECDGPLDGQVAPPRERH